MSMDLSLQQPLADAVRVTPMMEQYIEIKAANPDALLFYRMGDFYELFFADAEIASRSLGIMLTKRGKHQGRDIPMCGVPVVRADEYLHRLIALGHRVAICEQMEDPAESKRRGSKSVVRRAVVRLVTPGTITEETLLEPASAHLLMSVCAMKIPNSEIRFGFAHLDMSTGQFGVGECDKSGLQSEVARLDPKEIILADLLHADPAFTSLWREARAAVTPVGRDMFDGLTAGQRLARFYGVATIDGFGAFTPAELAAAAAITAYVERTQVGKRPALDPPRRGGEAAYMAIDAATRANLELTRTLAGGRAGSLLDAIDRTVTPAGARLLAGWVASPLTDPEAILRRQDALAWFQANAKTRSALRVSLKLAPDIARALGRLALDRGGPRDLACLRDGLFAMASVSAQLGMAADLPALLQGAVDSLAKPDQAIAEHLAAALAGELPVHKRDGNFVRPDYDDALDATRRLRDESRQVIAALQARYGDETGIKQLKIKHNAMLGYFIEVPQASGETLLAPPLRETFVHRQTMAGTMRFTTTELGDLEQRIAEAATQVLAAELAIFETLAGLLTADAAAIRAAAETMAALDVCAALALLADEEVWTRPKIDRSTAFTLTAARHPVVEAACRREGRPFIANSCDLSGDGAGAIWLLTGPNMAGKSTFLRQNALIAILAQMGAFVPAKSAHIGIVDALFSRVGAADDLARGRSTFMVEMVETAAILNQAGPRSLVILDEIGRGTATFDGLSIAWAAIEHLHDTNKCRAVFATHYHELTQLAQTLSRLRNATMRVTEWNGEVVFLHEVAAGAADRSYGIQVAKLAGLPLSVIARAKTILQMLEAGDRREGGALMADDLPLFAAVQTKAVPPDALLDALDEMDPDMMTPRDALEALYVLKEKRDLAKYS